MAASNVETALLVEDEPDVMFLIGYEVVAASSASEAATILKEHANINVVFTDIAMPHRMNGWNRRVWHRVNIRRSRSC
ncbi:hypothetical protein BZM27_34520 [Paraburkholderia steynii]|uniref:Response regulatory domain-containing protein n=1 Tax=Paraburkholderia steynii TaxID=1245441 RepID=A0A4R0XEG8_9BURK|nr:hypothetical protein BZM27_34520 [Paraburkholderia steynii]